MLYALSQTKERIKASKGLEGYCPDCGQPLIPKCGMIKIHHWGHKNLSPDCKYDYHDMCEWHYKWQELAETFGYDTEISFKERRADICGLGRIVEIQHSTISLEEIIKRSKFYRSKGYKIDWIFDMTEKERISKPIEKYITKYKMGRIFLDYGNQIEEFNPTEHSYKFRVQTYNDIFNPKRIKYYNIKQYNNLYNYFDPNIILNFEDNRLARIKKELEIRKRLYQLYIFESINKNIEELKKLELYEKLKEFEIDSKIEIYRMLNYAKKLRCEIENMKNFGYTKDGRMWKSY